MAMPGLLLYRRRRMGRVVPAMYDLNLSRAKDRMLAQAVRELAWERANHPSKCPVKRGAFSAAASPIRYFDGTLPRLRVSVSDNRSRAFIVQDAPSDKILARTAAWAVALKQLAG